LIRWRYLEHEFGVIQYKKIDLIFKKLKKASYNTWWLAFMVSEFLIVSLNSSRFRFTHSVEMLKLIWIKQGHQVW